MKKISFISIILAGIVLSSCNSDKTLQLNRKNVDKVLAAMTLEEKVHLLIGTGMAGFGGDSAVVGETKNLVPGAAGTTYPIPRLGIPAIVLADGPAGLRIAPKREDDSATYYCTAFPIATMLSSTWNTKLVENVGEAMGNEVLEYGVDVLLGPGMNIHRNPLCGRNFEYYSEDPVISGKMAAAITRGVQSNGVGVSLKHFAANNQETNRMENDVRISQRALREIYLKGFEIAVREAQPRTVMTSYNRINGVYSSESKELLTAVLRDEWGFNGAVMTDWFGGKNAPAQVAAGNDMLQPGTRQQYDAILAAVNDGTLDIADIDRNVKRILNLIVQSPRFKNYQFGNKPDLKAHALITRNSANEGIVLLENNGALPFNENIKTVAAYGITSYDFISGGTGSGDVNEAYTVSLKDALAAAGYKLNCELSTLYENHIAAENEKNKPDPNNRFAMFMPKIRAAELLPDEKQLAKTVAESDIALITIGRNSGEFADRTLADFSLTTTEHQLIENVAAAYHAANKQVVVVLNIGGVIETASWKTLPDAVLLAWQPGQEGGNSVVDILSGKINPSGKLPMTFPVNYMDVASSVNFPFDYTAPKMPVIFPADNAKKEPVKNVDYTNYEEDIYVGYRYFSTFDAAVSYPFGYGLSYTEFEYSNPKISGKNGNYKIYIDVKNIGQVAGKEIVELYVAAPAKTMKKPAKELKAFAKTKLLAPNETQRITLELTPSLLASFNESTAQWLVEQGDYTAQIAASAADVRQTVNFSVASEIVAGKAGNVKF
ncbi:MAG: beta-glucosidase [Bacteroidales bacterium]|jgi:beta-glucosidase|nr:beta-glucosidase [Bacteroidales bacterium]